MVRWCVGQGAGDECQGGGRAVEERRGEFGGGVARGYWSVDLATTKLFPLWRTLSALRQHCSFQTGPAGIPYKSSNDLNALVNCPLPAFFFSPFALALVLKTFPSVLFLASSKCSFCSACLPFSAPLLFPL